MYSWKRSPRDCVTKLRDNGIFKALLRIKKSFKSIDFDLAKHALVFNVNHCWDLFEKFQILKLRWAYWEADLAATSNQEKNIERGRDKYDWKSGYDTLEKTDIKLAHCTQIFRLIKNIR